MFKIENNVIKLTRGDRCIFDLAIDDYTIQNTDYINFKIYKKNGLSNPPLLSKTINQVENNKFVIELQSEDTKIGDLLSQPMEYWYEIEMNGNDTVLGYDEQGAKQLFLYPEGADVNE